MRTVRPNESDDQDTLTDPDEVKALVLRWRTSLSDSHSNLLLPAPDWPEADDVPYFTDRPDWEGYSSLLLWAAYEAHPEFKRPTCCVEDWSEDPAFQAAQADGWQGRYPHLLEAEFWFPFDFPCGFRAEDAAGEQVSFGSCVRLVAELEELNRRTWRFEMGELGGSPGKDGELCSDLERGARFSYEIFLRLGRKAVEHKLPMKLDY